MRVYAGVDVVTGKPMYLQESTTDEQEAKRILTRFRRQVDEDRQAKSQGTLRAAMDEWLKTTELEASTRSTYRMYADRHIYPALGDEPLAKIKPRNLESFYAELRRCRTRCDGKPFTEHRVDGPHECRVVRRHRGVVGRPPPGGYKDHDCTKAGCRVVDCKPHKCRPLANSTIVKLHHMISGTFAAAIRWEWVTTNPADVARQPRQPAPDPDPPTPAEASRIIDAAWSEDPHWGMLVWLVMVTAVRRGELCALRWSDVNFDADYIAVRRSYDVVNGEHIEKDTKTHRRRHVHIDDVTADLLREHRQRYVDVMHELGLEPAADALLFSYSPTFDTHCNPDGIGHRYQRTCKRIGLDSHLHAMRHFSATELITSGVDIRAVAGRLGHGGGGATTLRVYTAWKDKADKQAATILASRFSHPARSSD